MWTTAISGFAPEPPVRARMQCQLPGFPDPSCAFGAHTTSRSASPASALTALPNPAQSRTPSPPALRIGDLSSNLARSAKSVHSGAFVLQEKLVLAAKQAAGEKGFAVAPCMGQSCRLSLADSLAPSPPPGLAPPPGLPGPPGFAPPAVLPNPAVAREVPLGAEAHCSLTAAKQLPCPPSPLDRELEHRAPADAEAATKQQEAATSEELVLLSAGSIGHPHRCAGACRYVKRKGGCRDGTNCSKCHLCFWRRTEERNPALKAGETDGEVCISIGTRGHPHTCGAACRYVRRKGGCRDGASCTNCHVCLWQREKCAGPAQEAQAEVAVVDESSSAIFRESGMMLRELLEAMLREQTFAS
mmetsp:Transcript_13397/g.36523  ORF Transcript_13397/g.36523 Transcript_13397/m.36523 type:complete len:358 (+) Transcript_13397:85-1158(+)